MREGKSWCTPYLCLCLLLLLENSSALCQRSGGCFEVWMTSVYTVQTRVSDAGFLLPVNIFQGGVIAPAPPLIVMAALRGFKHNFKGETTFTMTGTVYRRLMLGLIAHLQDKLL